MNRILRGVFSSMAVLTCAFSLPACTQKPPRQTVVKHVIKDSNNETVDVMKAGSTYQFTVWYHIDEKNQDEFSFSSYISANDNALVTYVGGYSLNYVIEGNFLTVNYKGKGKDCTIDNPAIATYQIAAKSKGDIYLRFKDMDNIMFFTNEIKLTVEEA